MPTTIKSRNSGCVVKASIAIGDVDIDDGVCMARSATYCKFLRRWPIGSDHSHGQTENMTAMPVANIAASFPKSPRPAKRGEGGAKRRVRGDGCRVAPLIRR